MCAAAARLGPQQQEDRAGWGVQAGGTPVLDVRCKLGSLCIHRVQAEDLLSGSGVQAGVRSCPGCGAQVSS